MKNMFKQYNYFSLSEQEMKEIWNNAIFIFDANVLLNLYRYKDSSRIELFGVIEKIKDRVWIPHHVALEYYKNRMKVIIQQLDLFDKSTKSIEETSGALNKSIEANQLRRKHSPINLDSFQEKINNLCKEEIAEIKRLKAESYSNFFPDDQIKNSLEVIFESKVGEKPSCQKDLDAVFEQAKKRFTKKLAPGYQDENKNDFCLDSGLEYDKKYSDFLIWQQIINFAQKEEVENIVFITSDSKNDWWTVESNAGKHFKQPKPELLDDIYCLNSVNNFRMVDAELFLENCKKYLDEEISDQTLSEVKNVEREYLSNYKLKTPLNTNSVSDLNPEYFNQITSLLDKSPINQNFLTLENNYNRGISEAIETIKKSELSGSATALRSIAHIKNSYLLELLSKNEAALDEIRKNTRGFENYIDNIRLYSNLNIDKSDKDKD